jgi:hypothetical protein
LAVLVIARMYRLNAFGEKFALSESLKERRRSCAILLLAICVALNDDRLTTEHKDDG